ncbi:MAG: PAS domain S-box protein [Nitrospirae bacterium]|nr:PAS domain S-box protein [Nitrospirota bacterium]
MNVLLVDDDADIGVMMKMKLSREAPGFSFRYVDGGHKCLDYLKDNQVDCILSDYQMPEMDGMQLLQEIRGRGAEVPFIFLTGQGNEQVARDAFKNGAYDYFTKDIGFAHFTRIINSVEQAVRQRQALESKVLAESALLEEKNKLEGILANVGDGISIQDREFRVLYQNPAHMAMVGNHKGEFCYKGYEGRDTVCEGCPVAKTFEDGGLHQAQRVLDGEAGPVCYDINASPLLDAAGNVVGGIEAVRDVTERIRLEDARHRSEEALKEAQRIAQLGNWTLDIANNVLTWSDEIYRMFETDPDSFGATYESFLGFVHPDDREFVNSSYTGSIKGRNNYDIVHRILMKDGRVKFVNDRCETYYDADGNPVRSIGTVQDVTERTLAEERLAKTNRDLKMLSECNQALVRSKDEASLLDEVCRNIVGIGGYPTACVHLAAPGAPGGMRLAAHAGQEDVHSDVVIPICSGIDSVMDPVGRVLCTGEMFLANDLSVRYGPGPAAGGGDVDGCGYASFIGLPLFIDSRPEGVLCIYGSCAGSFDDEEVRLLHELASDISFGIQTLRIREEKDKTAEALKSSQIYLETIIENEPECVKLIRPDGTLQFMNRAGLTMIQAETFEQVKDKPVNKLIAPEHLDAFMAVGGKVFGGENASLEFDMIGFNGRRLTLETHAVPLRDPDGNIIALLGVTRDVTEQRRVERELVRTNEMLSQILNSVNFGMMVVGRDRRLRMANQTAVRMMGYRSEADVVGKVCSKVICQSGGGRCPILDEGKSFDFSERELMTAAGDHIDILKSVSQVRLGDEDVLLETFVDISGMSYGCRSLCA